MCGVSRCLPDRTSAVGTGFVVRRAEADLTPDDHASISDLLVAAFPKRADIFRAASWYGARPNYRLWVEDSSGAIEAHPGFERRLIGVGERDVLVAGVGGVATHPRWRGKGLGRRIMAELRRVLTTETPTSFGYLGCREEVVGFYERVGWHRIHRKVRDVNPDTRQWTTSEDPSLITPATEPLSEWPEVFVSHFLLLTSSEATQTPSRAPRPL